ncbi:MAG: hypothetical protein QME81_04655 [bacterium]|nr:hypothetical protein [bacterium]
METQVLTREQYKQLSKGLLKAIGEYQKIIPINTLKHPRYSLKRPIYILIEFEGGTVIASLDDIEAFAYEDTEFEAIDRLCEEIVDLYEDLKSEKEENLGKLPKRWLAYLEEIIVCR